ncbi:TonB-dependent Receptor Plug Domain [Roseateles sp. YR242]|uniref:TonB-dependent receptor n=1 Tax=Roseateles sp. YR242 TaxID=1855305 RepID=UPI0008BB2A71|nr:TonB-dependent receptor [Roseateles sp. YR242]SEL11111.1 TonB-dependent Receptor Plug Domain [Roseateles sp. YR242]
MNDRRLPLLQPLRTANTRRPARTLPPLLAAMLGAGLLSAQAAGDPAPRTAAVAPAAQARQYDIPPSPLADALNRYAAEAGVVLVFDAGLVRGLKSQGLNGRYDVMAGFTVLLAGTPLEVVSSNAGGVLLKRRPASTRLEADADDADTLELRLQHLPRVAVKGKPLQTVEGLDRAMIRNMPAINGDLTSQLKLNPNIQYSEDQLSSYTGGEIAPAEISIHGAKPYQNQILLDGVSVMNDLDPGNKITPTSPEFVPGASQALAVDSSILCEVNVRDSNVSAEHGRFTGGVVEASICSARKRFGGNVAIGYTSSEWTHLFIDPARQEAFEDSSTADLQPNFRKWTYKTTLEARPSEQWGVLVSAVRRQSDIPLRHFSSDNTGTTESREVTQHRVLDTLVVKTDFTPTGGVHKADLTLVYAPADNTYFIEDYRNSDYTINTGGINLSGRWESRFEPVTLTNQLSYSTVDQSRRSDADYYRNWRWSTDKNWGDSAESNATSGEGAWGDVDQRLKTVGYKFKAALKPVELGATRHRVATGLEWRHQSAEYERLKAQRYYLTVANLPTTGAISRCELADGSKDTQACSATASINRTVGQYFTRLMTYNAGSFSLDSDSWSAYAEDEISWREFKLRAGVRADRDSLTKDVSTAPRLALSWLPNEQLALDVGANRYDGRSLFGFALQEKIHTLLVTQTRSGTLTWGTGTQALPLNRLESMKTPHDDELTTGMVFEPAWLGGPLSLRFTQRDGKDQVIKRVVSKQTDCNGGTCYIYSNDGRSTTKDWTLSWSNAAAIKTGPVATRWWFAVNKSDIRSNYSTYADNYSSDKLNDVIIKYDGQFMNYSDIPADNYNRPWTLRLGAMSTLPAYHLTITNLLRIRDRYQQILANGTTDYQGTTVDVYERTDLPRSLAIDTGLLWEPRVRADQRLQVKLTLENITNRKNKTTVSNTYATYERGRSVALEIGYDF